MTKRNIIIHPITPLKPRPRRKPVANKPQYIGLQPGPGRRVFMVAAIICLALFFVVLCGIMVLLAMELNIPYYELSRMEDEGPAWYGLVKRNAFFLLPVGGAFLFGCLSFGIMYNESKYPRR